MATLTRTAQGVNGVVGSTNLGAADASMVAVASTDQVTNLDGKTLLIISNQGGSTDTVTITAQNTTQYSASGASLTASNQVVAIATTERRVLGPFPPSIFNDANGNIQIAHSFTTSVKITCLQLP